jgi:hypothetical protein
MTAVPAFHRETFSVSRASEYFDARELQAQTGQPRHRFAAVALKELVDNALDAAETAGVAPEIEIAVQHRAESLVISVRDNGSGIAPETVARILDFGTRTSDKAAYRSPTRGAQGNALKTVIEIPRKPDTRTEIRDAGPGYQRSPAGPPAANGGLSQAPIFHHPDDAKDAAAPPMSDPEWPC